MAEKENKAYELRKMANVSFTAAPTVTIPTTCTASDLIAVGLVCAILEVKPRQLNLIITDSPHKVHGINLGIGNGNFDKEGKTSAELLFDYVTAHDLDLYRNDDAYEKARKLIIEKDADLHKFKVLDQDFVEEEDKDAESTYVLNALNDYYGLVHSRLREADGYEKKDKYDSVDEALCAFIRKCGLK